MKRKKILSSMDSGIGGELSLVIDAVIGIFIIAVVLGVLYMIISGFKATVYLSTTTNFNQTLNILNTSANDCLEIAMGSWRDCNIIGTNYTVMNGSVAGVIIQTGNYSVSGCTFCYDTVDAYPPSASTPQLTGYWVVNGSATTNNDTIETALMNATMASVTVIPRNLRLYATIVVFVGIVALVGLLIKIISGTGGGTTTA